MSWRSRTAGALALVGFLVASVVVGWPWNHQFSTYTWPGPFGWVARNCPGNLVAGFLQVGIGALAMVAAHRLGLLERAKHWLTRDLHEHLRQDFAALQAKEAAHHSEEMAHRGGDK